MAIPSAVFVRTKNRGVTSICRQRVDPESETGNGCCFDEAINLLSPQQGLRPAIERLPDGIHTVIGEHGVALSVGERQRVLLARAFLARPTILILDEATSNLDFQTEERVREALERLSCGRTRLIVAHRRSMLTNVDRVLVLRNGRIEQDGPPERL